MEHTQRLPLSLDAFADDRTRTQGDRDQVGIDGAGDPAIRDAAAILERAAADEDAAAEARARFRREGLPALPPDDAIAPMLGQGERVVAVRPGTIAERHGDDGSVGVVSGRLYLTTQRLVLLGAVTTEVPLGDVTELSLAGDRLLISVAGGRGLMVDAGSPRLLRTQIAATIRHGRA
jgi:hypothetical protein